MFDINVHKIKEQLKRLISEHENTAEEYFQEVGDEDKGNEYLAKAAALKEVLDWIIQQHELPKNKKVES